MQWDPKITTFPGLYIVSTLLNFAPGTCSVWSLRLTSLIASVFNVWLIYQIRLTILQKRFANDRSLNNVELETLSVALLPPMYFFAHLYYTDVVSVSAVLALMLFNMRNQHNIASIFGKSLSLYGLNEHFRHTFVIDLTVSGFLSVLMRQTNIVWVAMLFGTTVIDKLVFQTLPFIKQNKSYGRTDHVYGFHDILAVLQFYGKRFYLIPKQVKLLVLHLAGYVLVLGGFVAFVVWNGSIVVGDKAAHTASLHVPQLFYFAVFVLVFGVAIWPAQLRDVLHDLYTYWIRSAIAMLLIAGTVYWNTIEHPYLLADNRHYTFYVWQRFYAAHAAARYAIVPVYLFGLVAINATLALTRTAGFRLCLMVGTVLALCFQQMIEVRYFLLPFLFVRLHAYPVNRWWLALELIWYGAMNAAVFYVYATKEIYWTDFEAVQRLIW